MLGITLTLLLSSTCLHIGATSLTDYISQYNPQDAPTIASAIQKAAAVNRIDPLLLAALIKTESNFNPKAISSAGAIGLTQLMPGTARELGVNPYSIEENIAGGARYYRERIDEYSHKGLYKYNYALSAYNAGSGNVGNEIPSYTYQYIQNISDEYDYLKAHITNSNKKGTPNKGTLLKVLLLKKLWLQKEQLERK